MVSQFAIEELVPRARESALHASIQTDDIRLIEIRLYLFHENFKLF